MGQVDKDTALRVLKCGTDYPQVLHDQFPHVLEKIVSMWGSPGFGAYVTDLLQSSGSSGGRIDRHGFPKAARQEILRLAELHRKAFGR